MNFIITEIEPVIITTEKNTEEEGIKLSLSTVLTIPEFEELKKKTKDWKIELNGN